MGQVKKKGRLAKVLRLIVLLLILSVVIAFFLYKTPPSYYNPPSTASRDVLDGWAGRFNNQMSELANALLDKSGGTPIDVTFTEEALNGHLRTFHAKIVENLPEDVAEPYVAFIPGRIALSARWSEGWLQTVLSAEVAVALPEPHKIEVRIESVRAGRLPLPKSLFPRIIISRISQMLKQGGFKGDSQYVLEKARAVFEGEPILLVKRKYRVEIDKFEITPGRLHIKGRRIKKNF